MLDYAYQHWDVFTDRAFSGNQLAVFLAADGLAPSRMQAIAQELNLPESSFVLPPECADHCARVRIFTPRAELPMAGHPTIGTTFALARAGRIGAGTRAVTLELGVGPTVVTLDWDGEQLSTAWMAQAVAEFGAQPAALEDLGRALAVDPSEIRATGLPPQVLSAGVPFLFVPLRSRAAVDGAAPNQALLSRYCANAGLPELPVFVFSLERGSDDAWAYSRMFAPAFGIPEDPATGGASGPLGCYLVQHGAAPGAAAHAFVSLQGAKMGRPSRILIRVDCVGPRPTAVRVGGTAVLVANGAMLI